MCLTVRPISSLAELRMLTDDPLLLWAAQGFRGGVQAWAEGSAVAVAVVGLARRDRIAVTGPPDDVASIVAAVATSPRVRGRGCARAVVSTALQALVEDYGSAGLMVESDNVAARKLYDSFGLSYRQLGAASVSGEVRTRTP